MIASSTDTLSSVVCPAFYFSATGCRPDFHNTARLDLNCLLVGCIARKTGLKDSALTRAVVYSPQILENYHLKSGEGLSVYFVLIWLAGDISNLAVRVFRPLRHSFRTRRKLTHVSFRVASLQTSCLQ